MTEQNKDHLSILRKTDGSSRMSEESPEKIASIKKCQRTRNSKWNNKDEDNSVGHGKEMKPRSPITAINIRVEDASGEESKKEADEKFEAPTNTSQTNNVDSSTQELE